MSGNGEIKEAADRVLREVVEQEGGVPGVVAMATTTCVPSSAVSYQRAAASPPLSAVSGQLFGFAES
ncbi:hypothetical protein GBA63_06885 [Rubrobacter tropicus]|uniref:Uncharacterized protein n=1 Tax=Rubrobacter tropicus TaxID=2653851 RepID=A0A6G8Q7H9_9ACTN|nr:hypothetical protein [Rubrobacter tropicus]QIN82403.1 hypothetical protein GBA63_06885 [Rubrobacter tropicus]